MSLSSTAKHAAVAILSPVATLQRYVADIFLTAPCPRTVLGRRSGVHDAPRRNLGEAERAGCQMSASPFLQAPIPFPLLSALL